MTVKYTFQTKKNPHSLIMIFGHKDWQKIPHPNKLLAVELSKLFVQQLHISVEFKIWTKLKWSRKCFCCLPTTKMKKIWKNISVFYQHRGISAFPDWWISDGRGDPRRTSRSGTCRCPGLSFLVLLRALWFLIPWIIISSLLVLWFLILFSWPDYYDF